MKASCADVGIEGWTISASTAQLATRSAGRGTLAAAHGDRRSSLALAAGPARACGGYFPLQCLTPSSEV